jgi:hypothetical protein
MAGRTAPSVISPDEFAHIGRTLFGDAWPIPLAKALGRSDHSVRQLAVGEHPIDAELARQLARICEEHVEKLSRIARQLRQQLA